MIKAKHKKSEGKSKKSKKVVDERSPSTVELQADLDEFTREVKLGKIGNNPKEVNKKSKTKITFDKVTSINKNKVKSNKKEVPKKPSKPQNKSPRPKTEDSSLNKEPKVKSNHLSNFKLKVKEGELRLQAEKIAKLKERLRKYDRALRAVTAERSNLMKEVKDIKKQLVEIKLVANEIDKDKTNLAKRWEKEKQEILNYRAKDFLINILPTIDMFESALASDNVSKETRAWLTGFEMIFKNFMGVLEAEGVKLIDVKPKEKFNHNIHHAIESRVDNSKPEGTILEIKQKGYYLKNKLLRPAMVVVSKTKKEIEEKEPNNEKKENDEVKEKRSSEKTAEKRQSK